jgi:shikimate dehydrogenase
MEKKVHNNKRYGLVGKDIAYSFSRSYFAKKFQKEDISDCTYENFDLESIEDIQTILKSENLSGLNVTIPYKEAIIPYVDQLSEDAKIIGAVNTVRILADGTTEGHNTDAYGFRAALLRQWNNHADKALILGTGGASKAVRYVLEQMNIEPLFVSRNPRAGQISYEQIDASLIESHKLIINCTPIGTHPKIDQAPQIPYDLINSGHFLFDLIYNPDETLFLAEGKKKGATLQNGYFMLEQQAEKSWNIWNHLPI